MIRARWSESLCDFQCIGVMVACAVKPGLSVLPRHFDDQGVALPAAVRLAHPAVDGCGIGVVHVNLAHRASVLVGHEQGLSVLKNLKRLRHIVGAGNTWQIALNLGIPCKPVGCVFVSLFECLGRVGDGFTADNDSCARRDSRNRA